MKFPLALAAVACLSLTGCQSTNNQIDTIHLDKFSVQKVGEDHVTHIWAGVNLFNDSDSPIDVAYNDFTLQSDDPPEKLSAPSLEGGSVTVGPHETQHVDLEFVYSDESDLSAITKVVLSTPDGITATEPVTLPYRGYDSAAKNNINSSAVSVGLTLNKFEAINSSYTVEMVNKLFGIQGVLVSETGDYGYKLTMYQWSDPSTNANVIVNFENGTEVGKSQLGLN